jgi:hypothetical protein
MEEVVVRTDVGVSSKTVLRWIGEIPIEREAELARLFGIQTSNEKERKMVVSVASWFSGTDLDAEETVVQVSDVEQQLPETVVGDGFESALVARLKEFKQAEQVTLSEFVSKYNIIRLSSPTLVILGCAGVDFLLFCGFESDTVSYLKASDRDKLRRARDVMEAQRAARETSTSVSPDWASSLHGSNVKEEDVVVPFGSFDSIGRRPEVKMMMRRKFKCVCLISDIISFFFFRKMEDELCVQKDVFGVFDGHGGANAARLCAASLFQGEINIC